jgi:hypothetical protein
LAQIILSIQQKCGGTCVFASLFPWFGGKELWLPDGMDFCTRNTKKDCQPEGMKVS